MNQQDELYVEIAGRKVALSSATESARMAEWRDTIDGKDYGMRWVNWSNLEDLKPRVRRFFVRFDALHPRNQ